MTIGRNSRTLMGIQDSKGDKASDVTVLKATSNGLNSTTESQESEAMTGSRFTEDEMMVSEACGGDISLEETLDTIPDLLKNSGLTEKSAPANFETTASGSVGSGTTEIPVERVYGFDVGDNATITDGTNTDSGVITSIDFVSKSITIDTSTANSYAEGDTVTNDDKYKHIFTPDNTIDSWATYIKDLNDSAYYEEYIDCKISSLSFAITKQSYITTDFTVVGITSNETDSDVDGTIDTNYTVSDLLEPKMTGDGTHLVVDGTNIDHVLNEFNTSFENNAKEDDYGINGTKRRDIIAQASSINMDFASKFDKTFYMDMKSKMKSNSYFVVECYLNEGLGFNFPRVKLTEADSPVDGPDEITSSLTANVLKDSASGTPVEVIIVDSQSAQY